MQVTEQQIFVPHADEEVVSVQKVIKLADYEGCIVRGRDREDKYGSNPAHRSFFLPPYSAMVELLWSRKSCLLPPLSLQLPSLNRSSYLVRCHVVRGTCGAARAGADGEQEPQGAQGPPPPENPPPPCTLPYLPMPTLRTVRY